MLNIRNKKQVLIASSVATLLSVLLSLLIAAFVLTFFKLDPTIWKVILDLSIIIPLLVASLVTYTIFSQVMRLQLAKEKIEEMGKIDFLTQIYNRGYFTDAGQREIATANRYKHSLSAMIFDLDNFKQINDEHGHVIGDKVIQDSTSTINSLIRDSDIFARFGGDEFVLLLPHTDLKDAENLAERIVQAVSAISIPTASSEVKITVSIGVAVLKPEHSNIDHLVHSADEALYRAKLAGRNTSHS
jgi:diguanylate cyclase